MKKLFAFSVILLLASLPSFASKTQPSASNQVRLKRPHSFTSKGTNKAANKTPLHRQGTPAQKGSWLVRPAISSRIPTHYVKPRKNTSSTTTTTAGFVTGEQIPTGGSDDDETYSVIGDFNGDGKPDVAKVVYVPGDVSVYSISVVLSNGDGTFQAAKLTATANNTDDPIVVGDVNGDGKDDILMVHPSNGDIECGGDVARRKSNTAVRPNDCVPASFDVYLSNGDGTFTLGNNYLISEWALNGGILTQLSNGNLGILAIDSETPGLVISVAGNGDGTFGAPATFATLSAAAPYGIFFADFNGDGKLDFAGEIDNQIVVYLATSEGFATPVSLVTSDGNYDACFNTSGDLTGDGKPEIVSVDCGDGVNTITVYVNNGDGSFATGFYYRNAGDAFMDPYSAAIADVNGDGKNDVIVSNPDSGMMSIFLNKGDGSLIVPTIGYDTGGFPWNPALVADFTGDGLADLLIPDDEFSFVVLPGYGDGTFRAAPNYFLSNSEDSGSYTFSVATGDFNGDGFPDVVAGQDYDGGLPNLGIAVFLSNPDGSLQPAVYYGNSPTLAYVTVGDFNKDGNLDIAATDYDNNLVQIFLGNGDGTFTTGLSYPTDTKESPLPRNVITGDFNKDGKLDLAIANQESGTVGILFGNGDGTFGGLTNYELSGAPYALATADLNNDGYTDLAITISTDSPNNVAVLLNDDGAAGVFGAETDVAIGTGVPEFVALSDLNGDGKVDMVVTLNEGATYPSNLVVALGNGNGTFQAATPYASSAQDSGMAGGWVANVNIFDINGDGKPDLIYLNEDFGTVGVMLGNGDGTFGTPVEFPTSEYVWGMALADINNDGAMDVVTGNDESGGVSVLLNAAGSGTQPDYTIGTQNPMVAVAQGSAATYNLALTGTNLYNGTITLACTSGLPTATTCTFAPTSVVAQGNLPQATVLTITTTAAPTTTTTNGFRRINSVPGAPTFLASIAGLGLFGLVVVGGGKKRSRIRGGILLGMMLLGMMFTMFGCDSGHAAPPPVVTPLGSYTVVVTATGTGTSAPTHTLNVTLVVE